MEEIVKGLGEKLFIVGLVWIAIEVVKSYLGRILR